MSCWDDTQNLNFEGAVGPGLKACIPTHYDAMQPSHGLEQREEAPPTPAAPVRSVAQQL